MKLARIVALLAVTASPGLADISLPKILSDNMVLQRDRTVPIWGAAEAGEPVTVVFSGQSKKTVADSNGKWQVILDPMPSNSTPVSMSISGKNTIELKNILVGEVWFCSGQSNMEYAVAKPTAGAQPATQSDPQLAEEIKTASFPTIRLFRVEKKIEPPDVVTNGWSECQGDALAMFSAAGYFFAREIQHELNVPIGMIQAAWGGSRIEPWTPAEAYARLDAFKAESTKQPLEIDGVRPGRNFDGMVRPLAPFAVRGVLWYQGESNIVECNDGVRYADKMQALIEGWRAVWKQNDLPFYYVQIAPYFYSRRKDKVPHTEESLPELWEAQALALQIPETGMVPTSDLVDDLRNIHPGKKREVGRRLAALALTKTYGKKGLTYAGPMFQKMDIKGSTAEVQFANIGGGLVGRDGRPLTEFEIAGADGKFLPAEAAIRGNDVVVSNPEIPSPATVRFAWRESAQPNLMNREGLPAYPFRTNGPAWKPQPRESTTK